MLRTRTFQVVRFSPNPLDVNTSVLSEVSYTDPLLLHELSRGRDFKGSAILISETVEISTSPDGKTVHIKSREKLVEAHSLVYLNDTAINWITEYSTDLNDKLSLLTKQRWRNKSRLRQHATRTPK